MLMEQATTVRKEWSSVCDSVIHDKPKFIKRTRDKMIFSNLETMLDILSVYQFTANKFVEDDGTVTLSLNEIDLVENGTDETTAKLLMGNSILEYAMEYYDNYSLYSNSTNRKSHIPYVLKALILDDPQKIGETIQCQVGRN